MDLELREEIKVKRDYGVDATYDGMGEYECMTFSLCYPTERYGGEFTEFEITTDPAEAPADALPIEHVRPNGAVMDMAGLREWIVALRAEDAFLDVVDPTIVLTELEAYWWSATHKLQRPIVACLHGVNVREVGHEHLEMPSPSWVMTVDIPKRTPCPTRNGTRLVNGYLGVGIQIPCGVMSMRTMLIPEEHASALDDVSSELYAATTKFPPFNSAHEGFSVMNEEVDELWQHVKVKQGQRDIVKMRKEAIQVAAMAIRFVVDVCDGEKGQK